MITPSEICIILHIIRKPNSIIVLLFIQNISRALKIYKMRVNALAYRISKWICKFVGLTGKSLATWKLWIKSKRKMTNKYLQTKSLFKEVTKLAVRSKIRMNFLRVRSSRHPSAVIKFPPRTENCTALRLKFQEFFKVLLRSNYWYSFFYIFVYNMTFLHILPNFNPLRTLEVILFLLLFPRIHGHHYLTLFQGLVAN